MKILVVGNGAMGKRVVEAINNDRETELIGVVSTIGENCFKNFEEVTAVPDVIIDFSHFSFLSEILKYANKNKVAVLIATTGHDDLQLKLIEQTTVPIILAANTSLGVNVMNKIVKDVTKRLPGYDIELVEKHHNMKLDSPSGTAKLLLRSINQSLEEERPLKYGRHGNQKRERNEIGVSVIRGGSIAGEHTVIYAGLDEVIEIKHEAFSKNLFATGAIHAAKFLVKQKPGRYTMEDVLFREDQ